MDITIVVAMKQEDGSAEIRAVAFTSADDAGSFIADIFKEFGSDVAVAVEVEGQPVRWHRDGEHLMIDGPLEDDGEEEDEESTTNMDFECEECGTMFNSPLYGIERERTRTIFFAEGRLPEVDIASSETFVNFCSLTCRERGREKVFEHLGISVTNPGIGPIEKCSQCGEDIDMTKWHMGISESVRDMNTMVVSDFEYLAVRCADCGNQSDAQVRE
jgi:hypothetical protein